MNMCNCKKRIYVDNAATMPPEHRVCMKVAEAMLQYFGNPSSIHDDGQRASEALDKARKNVGKILGMASPEKELFFSSGGSESNSWGLMGTARAIAHARSKKGVIVSRIEHHSVLKAAYALEKEGFDVKYAQPDKNGIVSADAIRSIADGNTAVVALMLANNETGIIQPVDIAADVAHSVGAVLFCDAVAAVGSIPVDVKKIKCDLLSFSGHKFGAPKGVGGLYVKQDVPIEPIIYGGGQEGGKRAGTEAVPEIIGMAYALQLANERIKDNLSLSFLRDELERGLIAAGGYANGDGERLPGIVNMSFNGISGEKMVLNLDLAGISASSGAACNSSSFEPSYVLAAMEASHEAAASSVRFSLSHSNTREEINEIIKAVAFITGQLR